MKKLALVILLSFAFILNVDAAYLKDVENVHINPNGTKVTVYTTGDEYFRYTHDKNGNVLMKDKAGYYTYAKLINGVVSASNFIYGEDSVPNIAIKVDDIDLGKNQNLVHKFDEVKKDNNINLKKAKWSQKNGSAANVLNFKNTVIFVRFAGENEFVTNDFSNQIVNMFGTSNDDFSSVKSYVDTVTNSSVNLGNTFLQYNNVNYYSYQGNFTRSYYQSYSSSNTSGYTSDKVGYTRLHTLLLDALKSSGVTDNNNIDGDSNGYIDNIIFIVSGSPDDWSDVLWPHKWDIRAYLDEEEFNGSIPAVYNLQFAKELEVSVLCHELMHSLGIDDLYRYSYKGDPVGQWDMMNHNLEGTMVNFASRYYTGQTANANVKWTNQMNTISESGEYTLDLASLNTKKSNYFITTSDSDETIQLEYRGNNGSSIYDLNVPEYGLVISRIEKNYLLSYGNRGYEYPTNSGNYTDYNGYYIFRPNETSDRSHLGGFGDLNDAALVPCNDEVCNNSFGSKNSSDGLTDGAITFHNGTNTKTLIKNVRKVDSDTIKFEVFPNNDNMYLTTKDYYASVGDSFKITPKCYNTCTNVSYRSNNSSIATVDSNGNINIVGTGQTTISVTASGTTKTATITSIDAGVSSFGAVQEDSLTILITARVFGELDNISLYRVDGENEVLIKSSLTPLEDGTITYRDTISENDFGKTFEYKLKLTQGSISFFSNITASVNTREYLPSKIKNLKITQPQIDQIKLTFDKDNKASGYNVYVSNNILGPYGEPIKITDNEYTYNSIFGQSYYFKVAAYINENDLEFEGVESEVKGINTNKYLLDAPTLNNAVVLSDTSLEINYSSVENASAYSIYRSTDNKEFKLIGTSENTTYVDNNISFGNTYYYKVSALRNDYTDGHKSNVLSITVTGVSPTNVSVSPVSQNQLKITFDKVNGAEGYQIYSSTSKNGSYKKVATITTNSYTNSKLSFGKTYYYKVRSYKKVNGKTVYSNFSAIAYKKVNLNAPSVKFTPTSDTSVKLTWNKISGATSYKIYYSTEENGSYKGLVTVKTNYYEHKKLTFGTTYFYKVIPYKSKTAGYYNIKSYFTLPLHTSITLKDNIITANLIKNVDGYALYKKINNGAFELVSESENNTFEIESSSDLITYYVKTYKLFEDEKVYSNPSNYVANAHEISAESFGAISSGAKSTRVNVTGNPNLTGYVLYVSTSQNGKYTSAGSGKGSYVDYNNLVPGKTYYFKVRPYITLSGKNYYGITSEAISYQHTIKNTNIKLSNASYNSIKITWDKISNASGYKVYYKTSENGKYVALKTLTSNTYTHTKLSYGTTYYYKVIPYVTISKKNYNATGSEANIEVVLPIPSIKITNSNVGVVNVTASKVSGANGYNYYVSEDGVNYEKYYSTSTNYIFDNLKLDTNYSFKVSAVRNNIEGNASSVKTITTYIDKISNFKIVQDFEDAKSIKLTWDSMNNVDGYNIYLEGNLIDTTTSNYYVDKELEFNKKYTYSVEAYEDINDTTYYSKMVDAEITLIPHKVNNIKISGTSSTNIVTITYNETEYVDGYKIYRSTNSTSGFKEIARTTDLFYELNNVTYGTTYYYRVVGYVNVNGKEINGSIGQTVKFKFVPDAVSSIGAVSSNLSSIKVSWTKMPNVNGYELYYSTSKNGKYKLIKTTTGTSYTHTKLTTGKNYYYKVRSYVLVGKTKVYGSYSSITNAYPKPTIVTGLKIVRYNYSSKQNKISWTKQNGVSGYYIYHSTNGVNYSYLGKTTSTSYIHKNATNLSANYYKVVAYKTVSKKNYFGDYSNAVVMNIPASPNFSVRDYNKDGYKNHLGYYFSNNGPYTLRILSNNIYIGCGSYSSFGYMVNNSTLKKLSYIDIKPYSSDIYVLFMFNNYFIYDYDKAYFFFEFLYDGIKYRGSITPLQIIIKEI